MAVEDDQAESFADIRSNYKQILYFSAVILTTAICFGWIKQDRTLQRTFETNIDLRDVFKKLDINNDGSLTFTEFLNVAKYDLTTSRVKDEPGILDYEVHKPSEVILFPEDEIITIQARLKPLVLSSLTKDIGDELHYKYEDAVFKGIFDWKNPEKKLCNFAARHFSSFLPPEEIDLHPGSGWWIIPSDTRVSQLSNERYTSPEFLTEYNYIYLLLSMLHKNPFILSRFAPQGTVAVVRAVSDNLLDIVFRLHAEFQLNSPPYFPFWFTPSQFKGRIIANKNSSSVLYFHMEVPSVKSLNVDMEWLNGPKQSDGMEVDIGYIPQMSLTSTGPSIQFEENVDINNTFHESSPTYENMMSTLKWSQEIDIEEAYSILEKTMYPFKQVPYYNFSDVYNLASKENKLIHAILLWGALDDQSC